VRLKVPKPRLLLIWHEAGNPAYWDRFRALAHHFEVVVLGLRRFRGTTYGLPPAGEPFTLRLFDGAFAGHWLTFLSPRMLMALRAAPAGVVYVHEEPHALTSFAAALLKRGRPLILDSAVINRRGNFGGANPLERFVYCRVDGIFYRNEEVREVLLERGADAAKLLGPLGNGVSRRTFFAQDRLAARRALSAAYPGVARIFASGRPVVAFAGRIVRAKGVAMLARLVNEWPCEAMACGDADPELAAELAAAGVVVLPRLDVAQLREFYSAADVFILPSLPVKGWREQFGRVLIESIFCGTPAIGSRIGAIPSILGDDAVFDAGDAAALVATLTRFQAAETRVALLARQTATVESAYTWEAIAARVAAVGTSIADAARTPARS
jgi:glycosyltransferase involved in cell wall biosynthesis